MSFTYPDHERRECVELIPLGAKRILDVGCAWGGFGATVKRERPDTEVWGIEPNAEAAAVAAERLDRTVHGLFPADMPEEKFDAITFLDVLEHMPDPWSVLAGSRNLLAGGGAIVASIPNIRHHSVTVPLVKRGQWVYEDEGILDRTHLRFFTKSSMRELFESAGFRVELMVPVFTRSPAPRSKRGLVLRALPKRHREELVTMQYGLVARAA